MSDSNMSTGKVVAGVFLGLFMFFVVLPMAMCGGCATLVGVGAAASDKGERTSAVSPSQKQEEPQEAVEVPIKELLSAYENNEVRADAAYKGKLIRTSGKVDDVKKGLLDEIYITVGTGKKFEIPQVQCYVEDAAAAAAFDQGDKITVQGVGDGLLMNVLIRDCTVSK